MSLHPSRLVCVRSTFKWNFRHKSQTPRNPFFLCPPFRAALLLLAKAVQTFGPNYLKFYAPFPYLFFPFFLPHGRTLWRIRVSSFGRILKSQHCLWLWNKLRAKAHFLLSPQPNGRCQENKRLEKASVNKTVIGLRAQKRTWLLKSFVYPLLSLLFSIMRRKCCKHFSAGHQPKPMPKRKPQQQ